MENKKISVALKKWHQENKGTESYKKRSKNISKAIIGKKRPDMVGNTYGFQKGKIPHNKRTDIWENSEEIIKLYKDDLMNTKEIGKIIGCSEWIIENILRKNNVMMTRSERRKLLTNSGKIKVWNDGLTKETDERIKISTEKRNKTMKEQNLYGGMKGRKNPNGSLAKLGEKNPMFGKCGELHPNFGKKIHSPETIEFLRLNRIGKKIHTEEFKLKQKNMMTENNPMKNPENKKKMSITIQGVKPEYWKGFIAFEPYDCKFNKEFKNLVRLRDNFCCLNCGISEQKHLILFGTKLSIHHIDYNKKNTCLYNCCTLCVKCNALANKNRNEWIEYFQDKLTKLYNYEYSNNGEIVLNIKN